MHFCAPCTEEHTNDWDIFDVFDSALMVHLKLITYIKLLTEHFKSKVRLKYKQLPKIWVRIKRWNHINLNGKTPVVSSHVMSHVMSQCVVSTV